MSKKSTEKIVPGLDPNRRPVILWSFFNDGQKMGVPGMVLKEYKNGDLLISHYFMGPLETLIKKADIEKRLTFTKPNPLLTW